MKLEYELDFKNDYKNTILKFFIENKVDISDVNHDDFNELSLKFHNYQKNHASGEIDESVSSNATYSSNMMIKWLDHLEKEVKLSVQSIIEMAMQENVKVDKFPLHFELQLDIEGKSYQVVEIQNKFNLNI